ncbi:MAG: TonB-dependent receptor plug domain-containing protein, partial [Bacteroidales bacterium]
VGVIKADALENVPVASFDQALQGKATGLQVLANSGEPSAPASFQIRGVNSINAGTTPLFILDGIAISANDFSAINPNDIENISVLKDASSTSIYGARAANGVIVITTKRGKMGDKGKINVRAQYGFSNLAYGKWDQMNTTQRLNYEEEIGLRVPGTYDREALERININWRDVVFNNNAPFSTYELSASGASDKFNYFISGSYYGQEGIAVGSDFDRYSFRSNLEARVTNWMKIGTNTAFSYEQMMEADEGEYTTVTPISASRFMLPYWNPYKEDGSLTSISDGSWLGTNQNPLEWLANNDRRVNKAKLIASAFLEIRPIQDLVIRSVGGLDFSDQRVNLKSNPSYLPNYGSGVVGRSFARYTNLTWTNTANYVKTFEDVHNLNVLIGQEAVSNEAESFSVTSRGQSNDKLLSMSSGTSVTSWGDSQASSTYLSFFGRGEYNFDGKYFVDLSVRRDG